MKVVILCGGKGTRMGNDELPKPMFLVGNKPILWHIMRVYAHFGFKDFLLCLGYKGAVIRDYFRSARQRGWKVACADTGAETNTGGRLFRVRNRVKDGTFMVTYGDGLANIDLNALLAFHRHHGAPGTLTAVRPASPFGILGIDSHSGLVSHFEEKPLLDHWINGGFFVFEQGIFDYLKDGDVLEKDTFNRVVAARHLNAYKHYGFWKCMDTYKDNLHLNELWRSGTAPWTFNKGTK